MRFGVLGPLQVHHAGRPVPVTGAKQRRLFAVLLLNRGRVVPVGRLESALWPGGTGASSRTALQVHVSRLRETLAAVGAPPLISTLRPGYLLDVPAGKVDLDAFRALLARGDRELAGGRPEAAAGILRDALALWRGAPLADLVAAGEDWPELTGLEELRWSALDARLEADLAVGRAESLVAELRALLAEDPLRERTRAKLMVALARSGRRPEALQAYREGRRLLVDRLGLEPGRQIQDLHEAILADQPAPPVPPDGSGSPVSRAGAALLHAATFAARVGAHGEAARCWQAVLDTLPATDPHRAEILLRLGESQYHAVAGGRQALQEARRLFAAAGDLPAVAETELLLGRVDWLAGRGDAARRHVDRALGLVADQPDSPAAVPVLSTSTGYLRCFGRLRQAVELGTRAVAAAEAAGHDEAAARALTNLGMARAVLGETAAGVEDILRAVTTFERIRGWAPAAQYANLFSAYVYGGDIGSAARALAAEERSAELAASESDRRWCLANRCLTSWWAADAEAATGYARRLLAGVPGGGSYLPEAHGHLCLARLALADGDRESAAGHAGRARAAAAAGADDEFLIPVLSFVARLDADGGRPVEAARAGDEVLRRSAGRALHPAAGADLPTALALLGRGPAALAEVAPSPWADAARLVLAGRPDSAAGVYRAIGSVADARAVAGVSAVQGPR